MARKETVSLVTTLAERGEIVLTEAQRKCEELVVRVNLNARPVEVGTLDLEKTIPRQWYGYAYLIHKNSIFKVCTLDFENLTLYRKTLLWKAEIAIQTAVQLINIPNAEPGTTIEQAAIFNLLTSQESNGAYYFPFPQPLDRIVFWFPDGVSIDVVIDHRPWSDILNPDGTVAIPTLPNVEEDDLLELPALGTVSPDVTFRDRCAASFPDNWIPDPPKVRSVQWNVTQNGQFLLSRYILWQTENPIGLVGVAVNGTTTITLNPAIPAYNGSVDCSSALSTARSQRLSGVRWSYQQIEIDGVAYFVYQTVPTSSPSSTTIDTNSFVFDEC